MAKILIVEDEKAINDLVKFNLELVGHECSQVFDGESGLTEALKLKYDLIILDVMLPKYSGFEIMEYIEGTPVIFVTAKSTPADKIKGLRLGADDYITKPFNIVELVERVKAVLRRTKADTNHFEFDDNANRDHVIPLLTNQSGNARVIKTGYKGASAYETYNEAQIAYNEMLTNIYEIIYYRIYMHDAGFEMVHHTYHSGKDNVFGNRYNGNLGMISSAVQMGHYQMLAIDGETFSGIDNEEKLCDEYKTLLEWKRMYEADAIIDYEHYPYLNSAVLCTSILNTVRRPMEYKFYIAGPKNDPAQQIYPTAELENMMPHREYIYQATSLDASLQPGFSLNYENGRVAMSQSKFTSFAMIGTFDEHDDVLKMYFENYSYVFYKCEKGYVYSAENSKPASGGFDFVDGLLFEIIHPDVSTEPNPEPPTNDKTEPDIEKEQWSYLKFDANSYFATLTHPDGGVIAEGSYVKESDKLVFEFKTADGVYTYYFHYRKDRVYVFDKELSKAVPNYGFEHEMEFVLTEYEGGSCFLELKEE